MEAVTSAPPAPIIRSKQGTRSGKYVPVPRKQSGNMLYIFWIIAGGLGAYVMYEVFTKRQTSEGIIGAVLIIVNSLLPLHYWATGKAKGMPLFPIFALTFVWTFALPLLGDRAVISQFTPGEQFYAAITVSLFLFVGGVIWYSIARRPAPRRTHCLATQNTLGDGLFLTMVVFGLLFMVVSSANWLRLDGGVYAIVRAVALAFEALGCFVLGFRMGARRLPWRMRATFLTVVVCLLFATLPTLLLVNAMSVFAVVLLGYTLASAQFPWRPAVLTILAFAFLHNGKAEMRTRYWSEGEPVAVRPWEYPAFVGEWIDASLEQILNPDPLEEERQSLLQRASLMQLLLFVQRLSPESIPYMYGTTYAVIPGLFVPRIFYPDKPRSHEGTYLLNIHYGFQTREDTETTTIGFGLLNESYANFGLLGIAGLAVVTGLVYGGVTLLARGAPVLSFRALFAILVTSYSFQSEFSASVYVSALFQSTVALTGFAMFFMRPRRVDPVRDTLLP